MDEIIDKLKTVNAARGSNLAVIVFDDGSCSVIQLGVLWCILGSVKSCGTLAELDAWLDYQLASNSQTA